MKVIERYILRRAFTVFIGSLTATLAIVWVTQALTRINLVTSSGQSIASFLQISTLILPSVIPEVLPFAVALAVAQTLMTMNADSELVVINAAGSSRSVVAKPILLLALMASLLAFFFINVVNPAARSEFRDRIAAARGDLINLVLQEGTFRQIEAGLFIQVRQQLAEGNLGGVFVADSRTPGIDLVYYAKEGALSQDGPTKLLVMRNGQIQRKTMDGKISTIRFDTYALDMSHFGAVANSLTMSAKDQTLEFLLNPDPNDANYQKFPVEFKAELHRRFVEWTYPIVFALIAIAVAGGPQSSRQKRLSPVNTVVGFALIVRLIAFFVASQAAVEARFIPLVYAVPLLTALIALWFIVTNRALDVPPGLIDWFATRGERINRRIAGAAGGRRARQAL